MPHLHHSLNSQRLPVLPEELIVEILLRLPVKSLVQYKCVCKSWKTLISDSQFANNHHLLTSKAYPRLFLNDGVHEIVSYPVNSLLENPSTPVIPLVSFSFRMDLHSILGSCNGLLCLYHIHTRQCKLLNPSIQLKSQVSPTIVLDFEIIIHHGFGYDQVNHKYKLLLVVRDVVYWDLEPMTRIYTFGENSWKSLPNFPCLPHRGLGVYVSGTLNWIVAKDGVNSNQCVIISIDLEKENYGEVLLPQHDDAHNVRYSGLNVLSNCLSVCFDHSKESHWIVWMMKEYGVAKSWTKLFIIPHDKFKFRHLFVDPLFISGNGVVLLRIINFLLSKLVLYNLSDGRMDYLRILGKNDRDIHIYHAQDIHSDNGRDIHIHHVRDIYIHHESLVSQQW
ncbi:putative F-box domain-containing protein [Medicago truncatula]|nr:F-box/kelch-repeat protein At3g23880 [Medicago truncatula]RHN81610.1 putative F-box domain-containing protein [Medicago truncatula]